MAYKKEVKYFLQVYTFYLLSRPKKFDKNRMIFAHI